MLVIIERQDGQHYRGHLAGVYRDHVVLRAAEWLEEIGEDVVPRDLPGEYVIQLPPTTA
jgi:hypothetical protein